MSVHKRLKRKSDSESMEGLVAKDVCYTCGYFCNDVIVVCDCGFEIASRLSASFL